MCVDSIKDRSIANKTNEKWRMDNQLLDGERTEQEPIIHIYGRPRGALCSRPRSPNGQKEAAWGQACKGKALFLSGHKGSCTPAYARVAPRLLVVTVCFWADPSRLKSHEKGREEATRRATPKRPPWAIVSPTFLEGIVLLPKLVHRSTPPKTELVLCSRPRYPCPILSYYSAFLRRFKSSGRKAPTKSGS